MSWTALRIEPRDVLFFRDARPMTASFAGHGAHWPLPGVLHDALHGALCRQWPGQTAWESTREGKSVRTARFSNLRTAGPFPSKEGDVYLPRPADLVAIRTDRAARPVARLVPREATGEGNLPAPLREVLRDAGGLRTGQESAARLDPFQRTQDLAGRWNPGSDS